MRNIAKCLQVTLFNDWRNCEPVIGYSSMRVLNACNSQMTVTQIEMSSIFMVQIKNSLLAA